MELLLKKIQDTFNANKQVFHQRGLPHVRQIDMHLGQPDNPDDFELLLPAMFISYSILEDDTSTEPDELLLDFHLLQEAIGRSEGNSPNRDVSLTYLRMIDAVKYMLKDLTSEHTTGLRRAGQRPQNTEYYNYDIISMKCWITQANDSFTKPAYTEGTIDKIRTDAFVKSKVKTAPNIGTIETY
jgi:hypothetical protein